ncbi:hypothetical protein [uncultured Alistipes sp.]|jgi:hypothetical protein|uniref:hypothetical protein n=1 Tax=Alistipes sp. TaxID=1872444 RepID=UPI00266D90BE|nr:hypothetical protein [uncultured Alistipes sp.]
MKRILILAAAAGAALLPGAVSAQIGKQVEVTKTYVPSVERAPKLAIQPDMTDTVRMRPEIDYRITPLALTTTLATRPIRPATVTYWEFNRPLPFYLKLGGGYPANSALDCYVSTQQAGIGYAMAYVNHEGWWGRIRNDAGERARALRTTNRVGVAAGKYFGRRSLEGEVSYENRLYDRYGGFRVGDVPNTLSAMRGDRPTYGSFDARFRFGDDFTDLSRTNFRIGIHAEHFRYNPGEGYSEPVWFDAGRPVAMPLGLENTLGGEAAVARRLGGHVLSLEASYDWRDGSKSLSGNRATQLRAAARYGFRVRSVDLTLGLDYYWLHNRWRESSATTYGGEKYGMKKNSLYFVPYARLRFDLGNGQFVPFAEADGQVAENTFAALSRLNPYVADNAWEPRSTVDYNVRLGVGGSLAGGKVAYRFYVGFTFTENALAWYCLQSEPVGFIPVTGRRNAVSFNGELEIRPVNNLLFTLAAHGYDYSDRTGYCTGLPQFRGDASVRYTHRKFAFGVSAAVRSVRFWSVMAAQPYSADPAHLEEVPFKVPFTVDLRAFADWHVTPRTTLFAEGRNLANARLYEWPGYPEYGAGFTAGVRIDF